MGWGAAGQREGEGGSPGTVLAERARASRPPEGSGMGEGWCGAAARAAAGIHACTRRQRQGWGWMGVAVRAGSGGGKGGTHARTHARAAGDVRRGRASPDG